MLSTDKIARAFEAICEEANKLKREDVPEDLKEGLSRIISIARHQNDTRNSPKGSCPAHKKP